MRCNHTPTRVRMPPRAARKIAHRNRASITVCYSRWRQTCHFRKREASAPAEGPACGLDFARYCEFPLSIIKQYIRIYIYIYIIYIYICIYIYIYSEFSLRALQAQKWHVWRRLTVADPLLFMICCFCYYFILVVIIIISISSFIISSSTTTTIIIISVIVIIAMVTLTFTVSVITIIIVIMS